MMKRAGPLIPQPLRRGDTVAVVAPAFPPRSEEVLTSGIRTLERWGLEVRRGAALGRRWGYFAGKDDERARDLQEAIRDPEIRGILFARGGWGTSRIMDRIDVSPLARQRKVIVGYSDMTVLFAEVARRTGLVCGYGPVVSDLGIASSFHAASLRRALFRPGASMRLKVPARSIVSGGRGKGPLVGGCLTLLAHMCGTRWMPPGRGSVIFFEEVAEEPYRLDRMLCQLRAAGFFDGVAAVLVGRMTGCKPRPDMRSFTAREVIEDHLAGLGIPVLLDVPSGHGAGKWTLPLGFTASVDGASGRVLFEA